MNGINLLPWREEKRRARDKQMVVSAVAILALCVALILGTFSYYQVLKDNQKKRNNYLNTEIQKLDVKIKEIKELRSQKDNLITRMEVIQNLQQERTQVVHLFDDVVRKLPDGVYFNTMTKKKSQLGFSGTAQSNARISSLMNRFDSSEWFANPDLDVINVTPSEGIRLSQFNLKISQQSKKSTEEEVQ